jgi:predicted dehydrogenase
MVETTIGVGIIGVNADRGWAATAHIPALRALPNFEIRALSTSSRESADAVSRAFDVPLTFSDHNDLVNRPEVDLVVVTVKAPHHYELVTAALEAGKAVYCEWPLGINLQQAQAMVDLARAKQVRTVVGLQARHAPAIQYVRDLLEDGYVGEVLSTTMLGLQVPGDVIPQANAYMLDNANGANLLTVGVGHGIDTLSFVLGEFDEFSAFSALRRPNITIAETGEQVVKTAADQIAIIGELRSRATASVHFRDSLVEGTGLLWEINGTKGTLRVTAAGGLPGIFPLTISGSLAGKGQVDLDIPSRYDQEVPSLSVLAGLPAYNVGRTYAAFASDQQFGTHTAPDFAEALTRHKMIAAIEEAATSGRAIHFG